MKEYLNKSTQFIIPILTVSTQIAIAFKHPEWGLIIGLCSQPFWIYSTWKSYKSAGQLGIFITAILVTIIAAIGVINYWFF
jgi:hypothetical protein